MVLSCWSIAHSAFLVTACLVKSPSFTGRMHTCQRNCSSTLKTARGPLLFNSDHVSNYGRERKERREKRRENVNAGMSHKVICNFIPTSLNRTSLDLLRSMVKALTILQISSAFSSDEKTQKFTDHRGNTWTFINKRLKKERIETLERSERVTSKMINTVRGLVATLAQDPMQSNMLEMVSTSTWVCAPIPHHVTSQPPEIG